MLKKICKNVKEKWEAKNDGEKNAAMCVIFGLIATFSLETWLRKVLINQWK